MVQFLLIVISFVIAVRVDAQAKESPTPIQDNSFLIEEAYNQERGVVQHIGTFNKAQRGGGWLSMFTQEWPVAGQRHQFSYTIPFLRPDEVTGSRTGIGDVAINYRYQAGRIEGATMAFAPRVSLLLPTGASARSQGVGGPGAQINLPFSAELPASLVLHSNAGATYTPSARNAVGDKAETQAFNLGQSVIWLAHPRLNLMLEALWNSTQEVQGPGRTSRTTEVLLSPGIRAAFDFSSGLQVVPGLAFPIGVGKSRGERSVFFYLSFEHAFANQSAKQ